LIANSHLNRVEVTSSYEANNYRPIGEAPRWASGGERPDAYYQSQDAYAVSYQVDPNSAVSRDDILFRQGSTAFGDAYSYDIVIDMAEAMNQPHLLNQGFIIEGHASAEGSYSSNLHLSQLRAERIAQELVRYGVAPERLLPVGYGESEAAYPGDAPEQYRRLDRRVMIFRME
jgi:outer membrane protein OmpA-like peptidoglycan-associated protein